MLDLKRPVPTRGQLRHRLKIKNYHRLYSPRPMIMSATTKAPIAFWCSITPGTAAMMRRM